MNKYNCKMSGRAVREGIHKGFTRQDFCEKYGYSESEFEKRLKQIYNKSSKDLMNIISQIDNNEKKSKKRAPRQQIEITPIVEECVEEAKKARETVHIRSIEELRQLEQTQSDAVIALETEHKELSGKHRQCIDKLRLIDAKIDEIRKMLDTSVIEYESVVKEARNIEEQMEKTWGTLSEKSGELELTRSEIERLSRVTIVVYNDGTIEVAEGDMELDESGSEELYGILLQNETFEDMKVRDVKTLARAMRIRKNSTKSAEFIFDNEVLEDLFKKTEE